MRRVREGMNPFTAGMIALVATVILVYLGFAKAIPFREHFEIRGVFKTSNNITKGSLVRIAGVNVGKVVKVEHPEKGTSSVEVTMRITSKGKPIHKDATLAIRPRIFLEGNFFVDISPGTPSEPTLEDGDVIPINQTRAPVQLDQILTALQSDTRDDLRVLLKEYGDALKGEGAAGFNRSIPYWESAYRDSSLVADAMRGTEEHDLSKYEESWAKVASAVDRDPEQLKALISDFFTFSNALARESANLRSAVAELPRTLRAGQPALGALNASFPSLRGLARDLRPGVQNSEEAINASIPLARELRGLMTQAELRGLVKDLRTAVPNLSRLTDGTVPFYREIRGLASCQNEVVIPWSNDKLGDTAFPAQGKVYEELPKAFPGLAGESRSGDSNGQWFRVLAAGGSNLIQSRPGMFATSALPMNGSNPPKPKGRPPLRSDLACEVQQPPDLNSKPGPPPPQTKIDTTTPKYRKAWAKSRGILLDYAQEALEYEGLSDKIRVGKREATPADIERAAAVAKGAKR